MRGPARALALAAAVVALAATQGRAAAPAGTPPIFRREDSLVVAGRWAESEALLDSLARTAHARGDARLELQALLQRGGRRAFRGRLDEGIRDLRAALALAPQVGDTALWFTTLRVLALDELNAGRLQDASPVLREAGRFARAVDAPGRARLALLRAYAQLLANHFARAAPLYRGAARELAACGLAGEALEAEVGLARACDGLGDEDAARDAYAEVIARSAGLARWTSAANAWNNLGNLELTGGDPATALVDWSRALALYREYGKTDFALSTRLNVTLALEAQARYDEAAAAAESVAALARANGDPGHERRARLALAGIRIEQERPADALAAADSVLASGAGLPPDDRADAALVRVRALAALLRLGPARAAAESLATDRDLSPWQRTQVRRATVEVELRDGRPRAALARLDAARAGPAAADDWYDHLLRSRAEEALGGQAAALAELERAAAGWERWRGTPRDPEWREARGPQARMLYEAFDRAVMAAPEGPARARLARRAFDALQAFKARTLEERARGPQAAGRAAARATLASLQAEGLKDGELFLDYYVGPDSAFACAVTRRAFRWLPLGPSAALLDRAARAAALFAAADAPAAALPACDAAQAALGAALLGPAADLVRGARRVLVSADGALAQLPFGALALDGAPLVDGREVVLAPSATLLRGRGAAGAAGPAALLAVAGDAGPGAESEVDWLARHVAVVTRAAAGGRDALLAQLAGCDAVHVAAHTEVNVDAPWRSGIRLAAGEPPRERDCLRAGAIARLRLRARLAVLAGCQSYGSRELFGEGALGLSTAFLGAGVPAVVCTLWPVDDRATAAFTEDFYARLLAGDAPAAALRAAQLAARGRPATRHPFYWAGFVLVGDPDVRVGLRRHA